MASAAAWLARCALPAALLLSLCFVRPRTGAAATEELKDLPVNRWVRLDSPIEAGYTYSQPIWVPTRRQVLHWGAVRGGDSRPFFRNDVRAFDTTAMRWTADYPRAERLPGLGTHSSHGMGVSHKGAGVMLECGTPAPSMIVNGVCWDARRKRVVYTMKGLMAAYDPESRRWRDMKAKTVLYGREYAGGPPVYGVGTCYDPVNDEIVLFPHWGGHSTDMRDVSGRIGGHLGTFVFSFTDNTWRRISLGLGDAETRKRRSATLRQIKELSESLDDAWRRRQPSDDAKRAALRSLQAELDGSLRVEPQPRCGAPMIYDPVHKVIVILGGHDGLVRTDLGPTGHLGGSPGGRNDTWLYDVTTRQWRELKCSRRPPAVLWPKIAYHPQSGLILLVTRSSPWAKPPDRTIRLWGLDVGKGRWSKLLEQPWRWDFSEGRATGWRPDPFEIALDVDRQLLLLTQNVRQGQAPVEQVFALRLDTQALTKAPAPQWRPPPPVRPIQIPRDDPAWVAKLKALPANTWVRAKPPREAASRGWGMAACDPVRGWVVYFGGGHSTYQVNNVAVYVVGANRWVTTAGDHNDWVPPVGWGGTAMGLRGGRHAHHQRNEYVALDGRMFWSIGTESRRWGRDTARRPGDRYAWFFDIDRGGVWRQLRIAGVRRGPKVAGTWAKPCVVHPDGRVFGFGGSLEPYDGRFFAGEAYFACYDTRANALTVERVSSPMPGVVYECRPFCMLARRNQVFFYECVVGKERIQRQGTWVFDIETRRFLDLKPERQPTTADEPGTVVYLEGQDAVFAAIGRDKQWVYSLKHNTWALLPLKADARFGFDPVYTQLVYVAKYGVLVSVGSASGGTAVMRPDVSTLRFRPPGRQLNRLRPPAEPAGLTSAAGHLESRSLRPPRRCR